MERRWQVLVVVSIAVFVVSLDLFIVNIAFPDLAADFDGVSVGALSWVLNAYAIVFAALLVPAGRLADRVGRRRGFLAGLALFLAGSALCGVAPSLAPLVAARVVQAAGAALLMPTSLALLLPEFEARERPVAIGIWAAVGGIAAAAGPPLGGLLVEGSWRLVFLVNLPVGLAAGAAAVRLLRETRDETPQPRADWAGAALFAAAIGALALGLVQAPDWGWGSAATLGALAGAVAGLALFAARSRLHPSPVVEPALLRVRSFALANAAALLFSAAFAAMLLASVLFLTGVWGDSVLLAGLEIAPGPLMAALAAARAGGLIGRRGPARVAAAGSALFALGSAWWLWRLGAAHAYAGGLLPGMLVTGAGVGLTLPALATAVTASLPPARFATGSAVLTMSRQIGIVLGVAVLVAALGQAPDAGAFDAGWAVVAGFAALGASAAAAIGAAVPAVAPAARPVEAPG